MSINEQFEGWPLMDRLKQMVTRQSEDSLTERIERISSALRDAFNVPGQSRSGESCRIWRAGGALRKLSQSARRTVQYA